MYPRDAAILDDIRKSPQASPDSPFADADEQSEVLHGYEIPLSNKLQPFTDRHHSQPLPGG